MATEIKMPQLGESVVEGTITKWLKKEGEEVGEDELLVEVSTDKVDSEVPSSAGGVLQKILVQEGDTVKVGEPIAVVGEAGEAAGDGGQAVEAEEPSEAQAEGEPAAEGEPEEKEEAAAASETPEPTEEDKRSGEEAREQERKKEEADVKPAASRPSEAKRPGGRPADQSKRGIISPLVRRLAEEHGVDLDEIEGSGTGGRIRKQDVLRHAESAKAGREARPAAAPEEVAAEPAGAPEAEPSAARGAEREELVPWSNIRRRTAEHMIASHLETARAWNAVEADWSEIVALREKAKGRFRETEGFNLTYMPFLGRVLCDALLEMPEVNATYDEDNQANRVKHYVNLGVAVALEGGGLIVPVVKAADEKNLVGLARAINDIVGRTRSKKLSPDDLAGGTFTITNPGPFGSIISVPIIPRGQTAILGFEAIEKRVVVTEDEAIAIRSMGFLSMSWDHRAIDGAEAARFLARVRESIEATDFSSELSQYL